MDVKDKIEELVSICKGDVSIFINDHRLNKESITEMLKERKELDGVDPLVLAEMERLDRCYEVHAYPDTQVGFYCSFHWDLDVALDSVIETIKQSRNGR